MDKEFSLEYTVLCGYEFEPASLLETYSEGKQQDTDNLKRPYMPQVIAHGVSLSSASHLVRTLDEHGEPDMVYFMVPAGIWSLLAYGDHGDMVAPTE